MADRLELRFRTALARSVPSGAPVLAAGRQALAGLEVWVAADIESALRAALVEAREHSEPELAAVLAGSSPAAR